MDGRDGVSNSIRRSRQWDPRLTTRLVAELQAAQAARGHAGAPPTFLDIGAQIGWFTVLAASLGARTIAVEPNRANAERIEHSLCLNELLPPTAPVTIHRSGLGDKVERCFLVARKANLGSPSTICSVADEPAAAARMNGMSERYHDYVVVGSANLTRLDALIREPVDVLKIDTEGHELLVSRGWSAIFDAQPRRPRFIATEFAPALISSMRADGDDPLDYLRFFTTRGYRIAEQTGLFVGADEEGLQRWWKALQPLGAGRIMDLFIVDEQHIAASNPLDIAAPAIGRALEESTGTDKFAEPRVPGHVLDLSERVPPTHWLIMHMGMTGGTTMLSVLRSLTSQANLSFQVEYGYHGNHGGPVKKLGLRAWNPLQPARVIMGHYLTFNTSFHPGFHLKLPRGAPYKYVAMMREPYSWVHGLYFHFHPRASSSRQVRQAASNTTSSVASHMRAFIATQLTACPCVLRSGGRYCLKHSEVHQMNYWLAPTSASQCDGAYDSMSQRATEVPCARVLQAWSLVPLILLNERYDDSIALLAREFGVTPPPRIPRLNTHHEAYMQQLSFHDAIELSSILSSTCLPDIYTAARQRFEAQHSRTDL
jgi:FkbM family methyltransferase